MKSKKYALTKSETTRILTALNIGRWGTRNKNLAVLMLNTGMRIAEALALEIRDVFQDNDIRPDIYVRAETTKGKKARYMPLNDAARAALARVLLNSRALGYGHGECDPVFVSRKKGRALCTRTFAGVIREARDIAGLDIVVTSHSFRHTFLTRVYRETKNLFVTQELAGHSDPATTKIYTHPTRQEKAAAVAALCG